MSSTKRCAIKRKATRDIADIALDTDTSIHATQPGHCSVTLDVAEGTGTVRPQHGAYTLPRLGNKGSNEDAFVSSPLSAPGMVAVGDAVLPCMHFVGVFDGHSSPSVSKLLVEQLPHHVTQLLQKALPGNAEQEPNDATMQHILQHAFERVDDQVPALDNSGSTATAAVITSSRIHLAWVGDSRAAVLGQHGKVLGITKDHRATREDEQERVIAAGGAVLNNSGLRVMGVLQCTRAIGDKDLRPYGVIPMPDVLSLPRTGQEEFLVLATDGLWDVMTNEEVYDYAHKTLRKVKERYAKQPHSSGTCAGCQAAGIAARALAQCARKQRGSRDDITVLLVNLTGPCSCVKPPLVLTASTTAATAGMLGSSSSGSGSGDNAEQQYAAGPLPGLNVHSSSAATNEQVLLPSDSSAVHVQQPLPPDTSQLQPHTSQLQPAAQPVLHKLPPQLQPQPQRSKLQQPEQLLPWQPPPRQKRQAAHAGLFVQPSVGPSLASRLQQVPTAAGCFSAAVPEILHSGPLSDLALSSPFAMLPGAVAADTDLEAAELTATAVVVHPHGVVSGGSAPPDCFGLPAASGSIGGVRRRSLSVTLSGRGCGSLGVPALPSMGSAEVPVVVLT